MDTGLATNYSFIEQGQIGEIVKADRKDQRTHRGSAGISRFKHKPISGTTLSNGKQYLFSQSID